MNVFRIEVSTRTEHAPSGPSPAAVALREAGLRDVDSVSSHQLYYLGGELDRSTAEKVARSLLADPVTEHCVVHATGEPLPDAPPGGVAFEIHPRPGVMDPVAETTLAELVAEGVAVASVRTGRRFVVIGNVAPEEVFAAARRVLANDCIETLTPGSAGVRGAPTPSRAAFEPRRVPLRELTDAELESLSRRGHLFLSLPEMRAIQAHYRAQGRDPTDLELETLAQTWSEHCVHKTLKSAVVYRGAALPRQGRQGAPRPREVEIRYANLLRDTIAAATNELIRAGRGPECLSVFKDNAGVIGFDGEFGVAFKVETHNRPSAIEPYGGAATGVGGCIRDVMGCGLGARPIANTDVFCVAPSDWPQDGLPRGVLHPARVLRGVVKGVADYGNRMGIPTVNGAIYFDPRYLGNPLVFCGCVGLIPRDKVEKGARAGDLIVLIGGRTGRDGVHGATFSSAELTDSHADEFSHAVQIGNAITEKRALDALLQARDAEGGCLYTAVTDCGAGGLSSAVGEMGAQTGATVDLETVPLKYAGLRYDEIWISEAQERMVLAVPEANLSRLMRIMADEEVEATVIGRFGELDGRGGAARLVVRYAGTVVGDLDMRFLHEGLPRGERAAEWTSSSVAPPRADVRGTAAFDALCDRLGDPTVRSKAWVIRQYDHEVQGGSVVKPLCGPGGGPSDAAVLRPRLDSQRAIAVGCGLAPELFEVDPYWMAAAAIDEAIRNVVSVGGDPRATAILDNFCWGRTDDPRQMGALVRACQACRDAALAYGTPFISGKDSLNNEFALDPGDVERVIAELRARAAADPAGSTGLGGAIEQAVARIRQTGRLSVPGTLLISALALVEDARRCVTPDLKSPGAALLLAGGMSPTGIDFQSALAVHHAVADAISGGLVAACHDVSDGGWLTALAEMAIASPLGAAILEAALGDAPLEKRAAGYVLEARDARALGGLLGERGVSLMKLGEVTSRPTLQAPGREIPTAQLRAAWSA